MTRLIGISWADFKYYEMGPIGKFKDVALERPRTLRLERAIRDIFGRIYTVNETIEIDEDQIHYP